MSGEDKTKVREDDKIALEAKTSNLDPNVKTKKIGQGEYASVDDSSKGNQLTNTNEVVGTA